MTQFFFIEGKKKSPKLASVPKHACTDWQHHNAETSNSPSMKQQHRSSPAKASDADKDKSIPSDANCLTSYTGNLALAATNEVKSTELLPTESARVLPEAAECSGTSLIQVEPLGSSEFEWYSSVDIKPSSRLKNKPIKQDTTNSSSTSYKSAIEGMPSQQGDYVRTPESEGCDSKLPMTSTI